MGRVLVLGLGAIALPAGAWAAVSGQQSLQLTVSVNPARAGKPVNSLRIQVVYKNTKSSQPPPYNTHQLIFKEAPGFKMNTSAAAQCKESAVVAKKGNATVCPAASKVGSGTVVINARPTVPNLITGTLTAYNAVDDKGDMGYPKGSPELILYAQTSVGIKASFYFHIVKRSGGTKLIGALSKPSKPGNQPGSFSIQKLVLTLTRGAGSTRAYMTNPSSCHGHWPFSLTLTNYFNQPSVTAKSNVSCTS